MKKFSTLIASLAFLLIGGVASWGQETDYNLDVQFTSTTLSDYFKAYSDGITLSTDQTQIKSTSSNGSTYYYVELGNTPSNADSKYVEVSAATEIESVEFLLTGNGSNKTLNSPILGWKEEVSATTADLVIVHDGVTSANKGLANAKWLSYDLSEANIKIVRLYRALKGVKVGNFDSKTTIGNGNTIYVYGVRVKLKPYRNETDRTTVISNVTVDGKAISDADLATLNDNKALTLADKYLATPTVKFTTTTTITYDSGDPDVKTATIDATVAESGDTYVATATIGEDEYTITVNKNLDPALEATPAAVTLTSPKLTYGSVEVNIVGANLTGTSVAVTVPNVDGLTCTPTSLPVEDGVVNGKVKIIYVSALDIDPTTVNLTVAAGETTLDIPVTYSSTAGITELEPVTGATTWDWATAGSWTIQLSNGEGRNVPVILSNFEGWPATFPASSIEANGEYMNRGGFFQGHSLKFITTVPGKVEVTFSNTGGSNGTRNIMLNGTEFGDTDHNSKTKVTATSQVNNAGEFVISSIQTKAGGTTAVGNDAYLCIYKVVFTPCQSATISAGGLTTFCPTFGNVAIPEDVTAYTVEVAANGESAVLTKVEGGVLPQGKGFVLEGEAGESYDFVATDGTPAVTANNSMVGVTADGPIPAGSYVLGVKTGNTCVFGKWTGNTFPAGKAYLNYSSPSGAPLRIVKGDVTGIENVSVDLEGRELYNVNGQKVDAGYKGVVVMKGGKMIRK